MQRLFVALRLPGGINARLVALMGGIRGARWQSEDQLHLTIRFIGEVDRHRARDVHAALGGVHHPPFALSLSGLGAFDRRGTPTALWAGVEPQAPLKALHNKVDQALARVGIGPDRRAYQPHITLARLKPNAGSVEALIEAAGSLTSEPFDVRDFCLYESRLAADGPSYAILERYSLA